ncbi:MAG: thiol oxidoreductase, partial [Flavobacteriaceae bacterium]|nr:thiol oxidoreductase [Flavobacteriaceae bacterium]
MKLSYAFFLSLFIFLIYSCSDDDTIDTGVPVEEYPDISDRLHAGGATTIYTSSSQAYSWPAPGLTASEQYKHDRGDKLFETSFVTAPATIYGGLGPIYNNVSCISCHPRDGRAPFPEANINALSGLFLRISINGTDAHGGPNPVPGFGDQAQNQAIFGYTPEAKYGVTYTEITEEFADGTKVILKKPHYSLTNTYAPLPSGVMLSPRIGTPIFGMGLLEAIPEANILAKEDINDADGDGISGKANYVWDEVSQSQKLGRFGWKASVPSVLVQTIAAFHGDLGITSPKRPKEDYYINNGLSDGLNDDPEIDTNILELVDLYCRTLGVPAPRNINNPVVKKGAAVFRGIGCAKCHTPQQKTGSDPISVLSEQTFYPYTDMLLHDMGENLADGRPDFLADGNEWKTRPLWGIGLTQLINGHTHFMHDGRAKNITEAILWHGGEAEKSKNRFKALSLDRREA